MNRAPRLILCNGAPKPKGNEWQSITPLVLKTGKGPADVHIRWHDISRKMVASLPDIAVDLLEVASFVYCADQAISRGGTASFDYGRAWRRRLCFHIAVRHPQQWSSPRVECELRRTVGLLTDDDYEFTFTKLVHPPIWDDYLDFGPEERVRSFDSVLLFSGGLDSLSGAVDDVLGKGHRVALVSHQPSPKIAPYQASLAAALRARSNATNARPLHIPIEVNKGKRLTRGFTQRSRSFLFASLGAIVARMVDCPTMSFCENGITSFNLPVSAQGIGSRFSRTTHPAVLAGFGRLMTSIFEKQVAASNPFIWSTKTDLLKSLKDSGHGDLSALTFSCSHIYDRTTEHPHCGRCSQCLERRLTALSAGLDDEQDPLSLYSENPALVARRTPEERTLVERYLGTAARISKMHDPSEFLTAFGELARALKHLEIAPDRAARKALVLHQRHSQQMREVLITLIAQNADRFLDRTIDPTCAVGIAAGHSAFATGPTRQAQSDAGSQTMPAADPNTFMFIFKGKSCFLGNTAEFRLAQRLCHRPGIYVKSESLSDALAGDVRSKNYVAKTATNVRHALDRAGMTGIWIDGSQRGHYALLVEEPPLSRTRTERAKVIAE